MEGEVQVSESTAPVEVSQQQEVSHENVSQETSQQQTSEQPQGKPEGFDPIDVKTASPEEVEARINRLYGNMKRFEGDAKQQRELNEALVREFQNLRTAQEQVVTHIQRNDYQEAEARLAQQRTDAWNRGDFEGYNAANDKINEIKIQKTLAEERSKNKPQPQQQRQSQGVDGNRVVDGSVDKGVLSPQEAEITKTWISETDQNGNFKRPWASDPSDPRNYAAALEAQAVFNSPLFVNKPIAEKLREVDRRMGIQAQPPRTNVLGVGNLTNGSKQNNIKLDPAIEKIAIRTKFGGPKAKTDQDHVEAWKRAVAKSKGGR